MTVQIRWSQLIRCPAVGRAGLTSQSWYYTLRLTMKEAKYSLFLFLSRSSRINLISRHAGLGKGIGTETKKNLQGKKNNNKSDEVVGGPARLGSENTSSRFRRWVSTETSSYFIGADDGKSKARSSTTNVKSRAFWCRVGYSTENVIRCRYQFGILLVS